MKLTDLATLQLTYSEVGATAGPLPDGYHHVRESAVIGRGRPRFEEAAATVMRWGMLRGAGVRVDATTEVAAVGSEVLVGFGPLRAPCRVVYVIDEADRRGFAYGTLPGHPESGEEMFAVRFDPATEEVHAEVAAFARHATWWSKLGSPVTSLAQRVITARYLTAL
ncbi:hypothetical protein A5662_07170 [Mycobacteriaceae bacterium 1482268.1]|nr:hypothetical protein A5662_07170 [Mycobacteriaceae bacterium 1482268.1]